jgi:hypothetical protein
VAEQLPATLYPLVSLVPPQRITPPSSRLDEAIHDPVGVPAHGRVEHQGGVRVLGVAETLSLVVAVERRPS